MVVHSYQKIYKEVNMKETIVKIQVLWLFIFLLLGCGAAKPYINKNKQSSLLVTFNEKSPDSSEIITFYALGDWGTGNRAQQAVAKALKDDIEKLGDREIFPFVIGLGDNVYPRGLPDKPWGSPIVFDLLNRTFGHIYEGIKYKGQALTFHIIPGNHDYAGAYKKKVGWGNIFHWEATATSRI